MTDTEKIADVVVAAVRAATLPLLERIAVLEARAPVPGPAGKDAPAVDIDAIAMRAAGLVPMPKDGRDGNDGKDGPIGPTGEKGTDGLTGPAGMDAPVVDLNDVAARAAALIPRAKDGRDGIDGKDAPPIDVDDLALKAAELIPKPKDGADGKDGRDGQPGVPGRDGSPGELGEKGQDGKDGRDGTLEGAKFVQVDERTGRWLRSDGSILGEMKSSATIYRGIFRAGDLYEKGDAVTRNGSLWIARDDTQATPGEGVTVWQLAAKAGRDGREGKPGPQGQTGVKGERGDAGRNFS